MLPTFQLTLKDSIAHGQATIGKFDGQHGSLACATTGGKVFIHSPHLSEGLDTLPQTNYLNINRQITAIKAGNIYIEPEREHLFIGTSASLQVRQRGSLSGDRAAPPGGPWGNPRPILILWVPTGI